MKKLLITIAALSLIASVATAEVLWDQSEYDTSYSMWDSESGCGPFMGGTIHLASDFWTGDVVTINQITTYYTVNGPLSDVTEAYLGIWPKTGPLPEDGVAIANAPENLVPVTVTAVDPGDGSPWVHTVVASGLDITLEPGEYWVSLTPANHYYIPGQVCYHFAAVTPWGDDVAGIEYCGMSPEVWGNFHSGRDAAILIEGTVDVVAVEGESWGGLKSMYR
jgi:hypothetical protein